MNNKQLNAIVCIVSSVAVIATGIICFIEGFRFGYGASMDEQYRNSGASEIKPARKWMFK